MARLSVTTYVRLSPEIDEAVRSIAVKDERSINFTLQALLVEALRARGLLPKGKNK